MINALKYGSVTLTTLLISLSLIVTTIWGFIFWDAKVTVPVIIGLIFVVVAIYLCLYSKEKEENRGWVFSYEKKEGRDSDFERVEEEEREIGGN